MEKILQNIDAKIKEVTAKGTPLNWEDINKITSLIRAWELVKDLAQD